LVSVSKINPRLGEVIATDCWARHSRAGNRGIVGGPAYASGTAISHVSPWSRQSKRTSPLSWPTIMFSTTSAGATRNVERAALRYIRNSGIDRMNRATRYALSDFKFNQALARS
jgi:hypothetical protein